MYVVLCTFSPYPLWTRNHNFVHAVLQQEIVGELFLFLVAGYDTTSNTLAYACNLLAQNLDKQQKVIFEAARWFIFPGSRRSRRPKLERGGGHDVRRCQQTAVLGLGDERGAPNASNARHASFKMLSSRSTHLQQTPSLRISTNQFLPGLSVANRNNRALLAAFH